MDVHSRFESYLCHSGRLKGNAFTRVDMNNKRENKVSFLGFENGRHVSTNE